MDNQLVMLRKSPPSNLDKVPYGTLCIVKEGLDHETIYYGQLNKNENEPNWQKLEFSDKDACIKFLSDLTNH